MPFGNVSTGAHNDGLHIQSAKRDQALGVAGLDNQGNLLALHDTLYIPRGLIDKTFITDRTSGDLLLEFERIASRDYVLRMEVAETAYDILNESMKDAIGGYAGLDLSGYLKPDVYPYAFLTTDLSFGVTHPLISAVTTGNAAVADNGASGFFYVDCGDSLQGYGIFKYNRSHGVRSYASGMSAEIASMYKGAGGSRTGYIGFKLDFTSIDRLQCIMVEQASDGSCNFITGGAAASTVTSIPEIVSRSSVQIGFKTGVAVCVVDGVVVATHTDNLPTDNSMNAGIAAHGNAAVTTNLTYSIAGFNVSRSG